MVGSRFNPLQFLRVTGTVLPQRLDLPGNLRGCHGAVQVLQLWEGGTDHHPGWQQGTAGDAAVGRGWHTHSPASMCRQLCCSACSWPERSAISESSPRSSASLAAGSCSCGERRVRAAGHRGRRAAAEAGAYLVGEVNLLLPVDLLANAALLRQLLQRLHHGLRDAASAGPGPAPPQPGPAPLTALPSPCSRCRFPKASWALYGRFCSRRYRSRTAPAPPAGPAPVTAASRGRPVLPRPSRTHRRPRPPALCSSRARSPAPFPVGAAHALPARRPLPANRGKGGAGRDGRGNVPRPVPARPRGNGARAQPREGSALPGRNRRSRSLAPLTSAPDSASEGAPARTRYRPGPNNPLPSSPSRMRPLARPRPQPRHGGRSGISRIRQTTAGNGVPDEVRSWLHKRDQNRVCMA